MFDWYDSFIKNYTPLKNESSVSTTIILIYLHFDSVWLIHYTWKISHGGDHYFIWNYKIECPEIFYFSNTY